jgi:TPR repeat protein
MGQARHWYEKAAAAGIAQAMLNLGLMYESGDGVAADVAAARQWYEKAAVAGDSDAAAQLSRLNAKKRNEK